MRRRRFSLIVLLLVSSFVPSIALADRPVLDLRRQSEPEDYEIGFCARADSATGHAFLTMSRRETSGKRTFLAIGHAPEDKKKELGPVAGGIKEERYTSRTQDCLMTKVESGHYEKAQKLVDASEHRDYFLLLNDCITFLSEVAEALGLKVPPRGIDKPLEFVDRLKSENPS